MTGNRLVAIGFIIFAGIMLLGALGLFGALGPPSR